MRSTMSEFFPFMSVPPHTSTSSSNIMPPGSLSAWLLTLTQVLTSVWRSLISRFILFISVSSRSSTVEVEDTSPRLSEADFIGSLHTIYGYLTGLLVALTGIKYQGSSTDPFREHPTLMMLFLISILVYFIALLTLRRSNWISDHCRKLMVGVCHICGGLACELLLLVLVTPVMALLINVSSFALIATLVLVLHILLHGEGTEDSEMVDLEVPAVTSTA